MSNPNMNYLLGSNWLSENSWTYYNKQIALVRQCLGKVGERIKQSGFTPDEALEVEMEALKEVLVLQLNFYSKKEIDPDQVGMDLDALFKNLGEVIDQQQEMTRESFYKLWGQNTYGETAKEIRDRYYKCPRDLP